MTSTGVSIVGCTVSGAVTVSDASVAGGGLVGLVGTNTTSLGGSLMVSATSYSGTVQNLAGGSTGGLIGNCDKYSDCSILGSHASSTVSGTAISVGGFVGNVENSIFIQASYFSGTLNGTGFVGGMVGSAGISDTIQDSYVSAAINCTASQCAELFGIASAVTVNVKNTYVTGSVQAGDEGAGAALVGGLDNSTTLNLDHVFAAVDVVCSNVNGNGFTGPCGRLTGTSNYNPTAFVTATDVYYYSGGLLSNTGGSGINAFSDTFSTGEASVAWFYDPSHLPLSGWDFTSVWQSNLATSQFPTLGSAASVYACGGSETQYNAHGTGSSSAPYLLCTPAQLLDLMASTSNLDAHFALGGDIDLTGYDQTNGAHPIGSSVNGHPFTGVFDGAGHTISHFTYSGSGDGMGLFADTGGAALIENLNLANVSLTIGDSWDVGAIIGDIEDSATGVTVSNCTSSGTITANFPTASAAGMIAWGGNGTSSILNSSSSVAISIPGSTTGAAGGLMGFCNGSCTITHSHSTGTISGGSELGGLLGYTTGNVTVSQSYYSGNIVSTGDEVGGLVGTDTGGTLTISDSYATGNYSTSGKTIGGLIGIFNMITSAQINRSYSSAALSAGADGGAAGLIGGMSSAPNTGIDHSFATGAVVCDIANGNAADWACGRILGAQSASSLTNTAVFDFSGSTLTNTGGSDGLSTDPGGTTGEAALSWFYNPANAPMSTWDFTTVWQSNQGTNALPTLR